MGSAFFSHHRMDFIHDYGFDFTEHVSTMFTGQQQKQGFGSGDEDMGMRFKHGCPSGRWRVASANGHVDIDFFQV